jgi:PhoH-like ATPase
MVLLKIFVLDTNILLLDPHAAFKFGENEVVIPAIVLEEVDSKKRLPDEIGRNARVVGRILKDLRRENKGKLNSGIALPNGGTLRIEMNHKSFDKMKDTFSETTNDNRILAVALNLSMDEKKANKDKEVILVSNDSLMVIKADVLGIQAEEYENDRLIQAANEVHKGYHEIAVDPAIIDSIYNRKTVPLETIESYLTDAYCVQDFFLLKANDNTSKSVVVRLHINSELKLVRNDFNSSYGIKPRNVQQKMMFDLLFDVNISLLCAIGKAGTGKTLLALAAGLEQTIESGKNNPAYKKMLIARPVIPMGKDIGYLPGDKDEKLKPWMQPIMDNLEYLFNIEKVVETAKNGKKQQAPKTLDDILLSLADKIQVEALTYIRGRSIPQQLIIIDEAQNLSAHEVKTIITRVGEGTKIILVGDPQQIDHPYLDEISNGLTYTIERMKHLENSGVIHLEKSERSLLAEQAADLL